MMGAHYRLDMRRTAGCIGAAGVAAALLLSGCGGGGGSGGGSATVKPEAWAESVCSAVGTWVKDIEAKTESIKAATADVTDPAAAKQQLATFTDDILTTTDGMLAGVKGAGTPDVKDGATIEKALNEGLGTVKPIFEQLKSGVAALPTDSPEAFVAGAEVLQATIGQGLDAFGSSLSGVSSPELDKVFDANATCQAVGS